jgi:hypothetical protein
VKSHVFTCGHPRRGDNVLSFKNGAYTGERCRTCHTRYQKTRNHAGRGALRLVVQLHVEGALSEGQVATATGLSRIEIRELADEIRLSRSVAA